MSRVTPSSSPAVAGDLDPAAVYLSPRGKRCVLYVPPPERRKQDAWATLLYCRQDGQRPAGGDGGNGSGFTLSRANFHLLVRVS